MILLYIFVNILVFILVCMEIERPALNVMNVFGELFRDVQR